MVYITTSELDDIAADAAREAGGEEETRMSNDDRKSWAARLHRLFVRRRCIWPVPSRTRRTEGIVIVGNIPAFTEVFPFERDVLLPHFGRLLAGVLGHDHG